MPGDEAESSNNDKLYSMLNIKANIPITLDLEESNYNQWKVLVEMQCVLNEIEGHLDGSTLPKGTTDKQWIKFDTIIKMWIFNTISKPLLQMVMKKNMTAHELWTSLKNLFECNKDARAMQLNEDLRNATIGDNSVTDNFHKMKVIFDLLENIGQPIDERTLVMHTINGLSAKYEHVSTIIRHQRPLPSFIDARAMLQFEETRLNRSTPAVRDTSASPTVLYAGRGNNNNNNGPNRNMVNQNVGIICRNFQPGYCRYGERCRFVHSGNIDQNRRNNQSSRQANSRPPQTHAGNNTTP